MTRLFGRAACLLIASGLAMSAGAADPPAQDDLNEIVLADEVRTAFYEAAPRSLAASMRRAVRHDCAVTPGPDAEPLPGWVCAGKPLSFLRAVNILGHKYNTGLVCAAEEISLTYRYYIEEMIGEDAECIGVWYDVETRKHSIL